MQEWRQSGRKDSGQTLIPDCAGKKETKTVMQEVEYMV